MPTPLKILNETFPISVLLVDDQPLIGEAIRQMLANEPDIQFHYCQDASQAIKVASEVNPTVILQDLMMPDLDGLMLVKFFRANQATKDIPLIVLSSQEEPIVKADAFQFGANDYMVKLPDPVELIARIRYHSAAYIRLLERNQAYKNLEESQKVLNGELSEAATYVRSLLPKPLSGDVQSLWRFSPSAQLGGDALGYSWVDSDHLAFYLLDVCGHGIGAALLSISIMNVLRSRTLMGVNFLNPERVLEALNHSFPMEEHNDMFFTIWYGVYQKSKRELIYSSGGHPPAILVNLDPTGNKNIKELRVEGGVIGANPNAQFERAFCSIEKDSRLYLFSDGIYELEQKDGGVLSFHEFVQNFSHSNSSGIEEIDRILNVSRAIQGNEPFVDDVSILELKFL
jgi:phosphoserine phosphatase RsbU/P